MAETIEEAQEELKNIEASLKRAITQIENSSIETSMKSSFVADLGEIASDIHHLAPFFKGAS